MSFSLIQFVSSTYNNACNNLQAELNTCARGISSDTVEASSNSLLISGSVSFIISGGSLAAAGMAVGFTMVAVVTRIGLNILIKKCESKTSPMVSNEKNALITGLTTAAACTAKKLAVPYASTTLYVFMTLLFSAISYSVDQQIIPIMYKA